MKIVGRRKSHVDFLSTDNWDGFVELARAFRKDKIFVPRGVYRFKSFEEAYQWREKMMLGEKPLAGYRP